MRFAITSAVATLLVAIAPIARPQPSILSPQGPLPIAQEAAPALFKQCSRDAPVPEGKLWLPSASEVATLEVRLAGYLRTVRLGTRGAPASSTQYRGQYVGFTRANKKYIYASYSPADPMLEEFMRKGEAMVACDGGSQFWGIVYSPSTGKFTELEVNGWPN
jgi:hypothetical protein